MSGIFVPRAAGSGDGSNMQTGANYFFGFLITFVVLLLVFIACGVGTRRRFMRRQMELETPDLGWFFTLGSPPILKEPQFHDRWLKPGPLSPSTLQPLSAVPISPKSLSKSNIATSGISTPALHSTHSLLPRSLRSRLIPSFHFPRGHRPSLSALHPASPSPANKNKEDCPEAMRWTVLIAMPSLAPPPPNADGEQSLPEFQFGVVTTPWNKPLPPLTPSPSTS